MTATPASYSPPLCVTFFFFFFGNLRKKQSNGTLEVTSVPRRQLQISSSQPNENDVDISALHKTCFCAIAVASKKKKFDDSVFILKVIRYFFIALLYYSDLLNVPSIKTPTVVSSFSLSLARSLSLPFYLDLFKRWHDFKSSPHRAIWISRGIATRGKSQTLSTYTPAKYYAFLVHESRDPVFLGRGYYSEAVLSKREKSPAR